jgi:hypothetical protein
MGRILPHPSGTAQAQPACAAARAHSRAWTGTYAAAAAALAMATRLLHCQRAPPTMRRLAESTTRRRERRGAVLGFHRPRRGPERRLTEASVEETRGSPVWRRRARMQLLPGSGDLHAKENGVREAVNVGERMAMASTAGRSGPYRRGLAAIARSLQAQSLAPDRHDGGDLRGETRKVK